MKLISCVLIFILTFLLNSCKEKVEIDEDEILLKVKLEEGAAYLSEIIYSQSMVMDDEGLYTIIEQDAKFWINSYVINESLGNFTISNQYDRIRLDQTISNEEKESLTQIDTKETLPINETELEKYFRRLIQEKYLIVLNQNSEEIESEFNEKIKAIGGGKFTSSFQKALEFHPYFPDYLLAEKDTWHKEISIIDKGVSITGHTKYQLERWDSSYAYISIKSQLNGRSNTLNKDELFEVEKTGQLIIDRATGLISKAVIDQRIQWLDGSIEKKKLLASIKINTTIKK